MEQVTAIFIPSLNRPHKLKPLIDNIRETTTQPYKMYFMVSDDESKRILEEEGETYFSDPDPNDTRYVTRMNFLYRHTTEPWMMMDSDDVVHHPGWLEAALKPIGEGYHVVVVNDLFNPQGTQALITRKYVETQSGCVDIPDVLFYPGYQHQYADTEQFAVAQRRGVFARALDSIVEHHHFANNKSPMDETYEFGARTGDQDHQVFLSRQHLWQ